LFFHIPNGGKRNAVTAKQLHDAGVIAGVPDLMLALPRHQYAGLFLELKTLRGVPSREQRAMQTALESAGYRAAIVFGYEEAKALILAYLGDSA
jgi:hypothetical protein